MKKYNFWGFQVDLDEDATKTWYAKSEGWSCNCSHCRNFLTLAQKRTLPKSVLDILDSVGIPPEKATYVCQLCADGDSHWYQFSYRLAGNMLSEDEIAPISEHWGTRLCCHEIYPYGAPDFPEPHFDLEFSLTLPWVLEESPNA